MVLNSLWMKRLIQDSFFQHYCAYSLVSPLIVRKIIGLLRLSLDKGTKGLYLTVPMDHTISGMSSLPSWYKLHSRRPIWRPKNSGIGRTSSHFFNILSKWSHTLHDHLLQFTFLRQTTVTRHLNDVEKYTVRE